MVSGILSLQQRGIANLLIVGRSESRPKNLPLRLAAWRCSAFSVDSRALMRSANQALAMLGFVCSLFVHDAIPALKGVEMSRGRTIGLIVAGSLIVGATAASASETVTYTYDAKGRLIKVVHTGTVNNGVTTEYTHDPADNRVNVKVTGAP